MNESTIQMNDNNDNIIEKQVKVIAIDMDGTLLNSDGDLSVANERALSHAINNNIIIVAATGRAFNAIPKSVLNIPGIGYAITSNGASIIDIQNKKKIYTSYISKSGVKSIYDLIWNKDLMIEIYIDGQPYISKVAMDKFEPVGIPDEYMTYFKGTRKPVQDLEGMLNKNIDSIENINIIFTDSNVRTDLLGRLRHIDDISVTSSFPFNLEISSCSTNKSTALSWLLDTLHLSSGNLMSIGDSFNDLEMLEMSAISVAMEDAVPEVKDISDFVTASNNSDGVAKAIEKFVR